MKQVLFIAGATASGKSAFALDLADRLNGVIINADSMQVYRDLRVITARPSVEEEQRVPHRLYGVIDGAVAYSAVEWRDAAMREIEFAWQKNQLPILVGGTGMYFSTLLKGMADIPDVPDEIRSVVRARITSEGAECLHEELTQFDPITAERLAPADSQRIARAIEVYNATKVPLSEWQKNTPPGPLAELDENGLLHKIVLQWPRNKLYARCDLRFELMLENGGIDEIEHLAARKLDTALPLMRALGVPSLLAHISGDQELAETVESAKMQTRRFAKRQLTWFRNQFSDWQICDAQDLEKEIIKINNIIVKNTLD